MFETVRDDLRTTLDEIRAAGLHKPERVIGSPQSATVSVTAGGRPGEVLNFCANNYLGLADHPDVVAAAHAGLDEWGFGMASVRFICGTQTIHRELEQRIADGLVKVNGETAQTGMSEKAGDKIELDGKTFVASALVEDERSLRDFGAAHGYPFIVKPTCGTASFGVLKVDGPELTAAAWAEIGRLRASDHPLVHAYDLGEFIMEEYIDGPLCSAEAFSFDGHHVVATVTEAITEESNHVHVGHAIPARVSPAVEADVVRVTGAVLDALGYRDGATHTEFKLTPEGPVLIETQARVGGALLNQLISTVYGLDLQELAFSWPLGVAPAVAPMPVSLTAALSSPDLMTLTTLAIARTRPACLSTSRSTSAAPRRSRSDRVTSALYLREADLKPRLGRRRCSGIWPPSKPTL